VELLLPQRKNYIEKSIADFYGVSVLPQITVLKNPFASLETTMPWLYFFLQRIIFGWQAFRYARTHSHDVVYSREITLCFFLQLFCAGTVVFEDHEPKRSWVGLYRFFVKRLSKKVIVAQGLKELYTKWGVKPDTFVLAPNGVDLEEFDAVQKDRSVWTKLGISSEKKIILYTGHFYAWKGVYTLLDAASFLPEFQIVLIGGTPEDTKSIIKYIQKKELKNVTVEGFVSHSTVIHYMKSADVLTLPNTATEERSQKYTTPIKLFEYMACGVPIVASDIPSFQFYLQDGVNAKMFCPDDAQDMANKIQDIFQHAEKSRTLSDEALRQTQKFTWRNRVKIIRSFL